MKTIRQVADEIGVSKTAIYKKIDNLGLRSKLSKKGNQFLIDENVESFIKSAFKEKKETESKTESKTETKSENQQVIDLIAMLQEELKIKNDQISALNAQLQQSHELIKHEQQLRAIAEQKVLQITDMQEKESEKRKHSFFNFFR